LIDQNEEEIIYLLILHLIWSLFVVYCLLFIELCLYNGKEANCRKKNWKEDIMKSKLKISKVNRRNRDRVTRGSLEVHSWHNRAIAVPRVLSKYINFLAEHAAACSLIISCEQTCYKIRVRKFPSLKAGLSPKLEFVKLVENEKVIFADFFLYIDLYI